MRIAILLAAFPALDQMLFRAFAHLSCAHSLAIRSPEHYAAVFDTLLRTLKEVMGAQFGTRQDNAWRQLWSHLFNVCFNRLPDWLFLVLTFFAVLLFRS